MVALEPPFTARAPVSGGSDAVVALEPPFTFVRPAGSQPPRPRAAAHPRAPPRYTTARTASCPHAASMSCPRVRRIVARRPPRSSMSRKAAMVSRPDPS